MPMALAKISFPEQVRVLISGTAKKFLTRITPNSSQDKANCRFMHSVLR